MKAITKILLLAALLTGMGASAQTLQQVKDVVDDVKKEMAPDKRQTVYDITADAHADGVIYLTGKISDKNILDALNKRVKALGGNVENHIVLLPDDQWALVSIPVGCMRSKGSYSSELATQTIMGMPVRLLEEDGGWWLVQAPDGYLGWMWRGSITRKTPAELEQWRKSPRLAVTSRHQIEGYDSPTATSARSIVTDLLPGSVVEGTLSTKKNGRVQVTLPDGRKCWADAKAFTPIEKWADQPFDADVILEQAYSLMGAPYLWGGTSAKMTDCSGLVKVSYLANGRILRRDASQQALIGTRIPIEDIDSLQPGDLMFFGEKPGGRVTHVGIYDNDRWFIHCAGQVHRTHIDPDDPSWARRIYLGATRIAGNDGTSGITKVINHPWYF